MKICGKCKEQKPLKCFEFRSDSKKYRNHCKLCVKLQRSNKRPAASEVFVRDGCKKCIRCGSIKEEKFFKIRSDTGKRRGYCDSCYKDYFKELDKKRRSYLNRISRTKYKNDINFKLRSLLRSRLTKVLKRNKIGSSVLDLGCTIDEFKCYIEKMFYANTDTNEDMTWDNYGKWHIDHIVPLASFDLTNKEEFRKAIYYKNLQPLWAKDNLKKGSKII